MIKIIRGTFGYNNGQSIVPKTSNDEPFECDAKIEKRLVAAGVAVYVGNAKSVTTETAGGEDGEVDNEKPYTDKTSFAELKEIAKQRGATEEDLKPIKSKAQAIELIDKLLAGGEDGEVDNETDEDAPSFDEVDGVEG